MINMQAKQSCKYVQLMPIKPESLIHTYTTHKLILINASIKEQAQQFVCIVFGWLQ